MTKTTLRQDWPLLGNYIYVFLPTFLFVMLWLRLVLSAVLCAMIAVGVWFAFRQDRPLWKPPRDRDTAARLGVVLVLICLWVLFSGIGGSVVQYPDHWYRNAVFQLLVDQDWPIRMIAGDGQERSIAYYFGFWLPAALVGKLTGSYAAGMLMQQIWAVLGLAQVYYFLCERVKRVRLWYLAVFVFFGGLDAVGRMLTMDYYTQIGNRFEWWAVIFNYPSMSNQLFWVFNQLIYALVIFCLLLRQRSNGNLLLIWSMALLPCTFPAVGMIPFVIWRALANSRQGKLPARFVSAVRGSLTVANGIGFLMALLMSLYLIPNDSVNRTMSGVISGSSNQFNQTTEAAGLMDPSFHAFPWTTRLWIFLLFALLEFGIYFILIYRSQGGKPLYWLCLAVLLACPWINIGYYNDFCMRASIPALFCLMELMILALQDYGADFRRGRQKVLLPLLIVAMAIGGLSAMDTFRGAMHDTVDLMANHQSVGLTSRDTGELFVNDNFSCGTNTFFFRHLMR